MCFKLLLNEDTINPQYTLYGQKTKTIVFTNFHCSFLDRIFRYENIKEKW